jgi:spermidine synthase
MNVLHDAPGSCRWITVREAGSTRYLELDGCEEGAMDLHGEEPVFQYLWLYRLSSLAKTVRRALVLGAGAFTAAKCLALAHPGADIEAVDVEAELGTIARQFFRLDQPEFSRVHFHGITAEKYLAASPEPFDFIFDDLFAGFAHVPEASRTREYFQQLHRAVAAGGVCVKNVIWDPHSADARSACAEAFAAMKATFADCGILCLGPEHRGHNRLLIGATEPVPWAELIPRLGAAGVPETVMAAARFVCVDELETSP